jgi:hypothetical protein
LPVASSCASRERRAHLSLTLPRLARELDRVSPSWWAARAEPTFPARLPNEPARAKPKTSEPKCGSHRAWLEPARVQPYLGCWHHQAS